MTRIVHILKEMFRNLYRHPGTAFSSFLSLMLLFLLFDLFWIASGTSQVFYRDLLSDFKMEVYVDESCPDSLITSLEFDLVRLEGVNGIDYLSREDAREELDRMVGVDLLSGYDDANPLPRSFVLTFDPDWLNTSDMNLIEQQLTAMEKIEQVYYSRRWLEKAENARFVIAQAGMALGLLVLLTALISSTNNIRLMTRARATGFRQMNLIGAGRLFVALPFLLEGFILSGLSAAAGWGLIHYGSQKIAFTYFDIVIPTLEEIVIFCVAAGVLGTISGYLGIRRLHR